MLKTLSAAAGNDADKQRVDIKTVAGHKIKTLCHKKLLLSYDIISFDPLLIEN